LIGDKSQFNDSLVMCDHHERLCVCSLVTN